MCALSIRIVVLAVTIAASLYATTSIIFGALRGNLAPTAPGNLAIGVAIVGTIGLVLVRERDALTKERDLTAIAAAVVYRRLRTSGGHLTTAPPAERNAVAPVVALRSPAPGRTARPMPRWALPVSTVVGALLLGGLVVALTDAPATPHQGATAPIAEGPDITTPVIAVAPRGSRLDASQTAIAATGTPTPPASEAITTGEWPGPAPAAAATTAEQPVDTTLSATLVSTGGRVLGAVPTSTPVSALALPTGTLAAAPARAVAAGHRRSPHCLPPLPLLGTLCGD